MTTPTELDRLAETRLAELAGKTLTPRDRMVIPAQEMPCQAPEVRRGNMSEVALGYSAAQARLEAQRCLQCKNAPCVNGCPVRIRIPDFVKAIAEERMGEAVAIIRENSLLPAVCGRVCPQETQCQEPCTLGKALKDRDRAVAIGRLERYVADLDRAAGQMHLPAIPPATGRRVAVIGSGPASITVAADVRRAGHAVTVFEAFHKAGGVLVYGIPEFRLPKAIVQYELDALAAMGVEIRTNFVVGRTRRLRDLLDKDGYDAVFVGSGAGLPKFMNIEGENLVGVFSANEYLTRANLMRAYDREHAHTPIFNSKKVAVLGGGNVAMDAARMALRLGAEEVKLIYRRTEKEMPARVEEVAHAREEGVIFHMLQNAKRILGDEQGRVRAMECLRYELGEPDSSGRRSPVEIKGSEFTLEVDTVIVAIGNESNPLISQTTEGLRTDRHGRIVVDEHGQTSLDRVYAGGDIVLGAATVILAMGEGRRAAAAINARLSGACQASS
ncbi:MAG: NADPH-dependent glutamate synthase [Kiritimatiellae bacterium]|nr:NADPH-dependent glutamate synthase [Kiritimatiellia bacterium]